MATLTNEGLTFVAPNLNIGTGSCFVAVKTTTFTAHSITAVASSTPYSCIVILLLIFVVLLIVIIKIYITCVSVTKVFFVISYQRGRTIVVSLLFAVFAGKIVVVVIFIMVSLVAAFFPTLLVIFLWSRKIFAVLIMMMRMRVIVVVIVATIAAPAANMRVVIVAVAVSFFGFVGVAVGACSVIVRMAVMTVAVMTTVVVVASTVFFLYFVVFVQGRSAFSLHSLNRRSSCRGRFSAASWRHLVCLLL